MKKKEKFFEIQNQLWAWEGVNYSDSRDGDDVSFLFNFNFQMYFFFKYH